MIKKWKTEPTIVWHVRIKSTDRACRAIHRREILIKCARSRRTMGRQNFSTKVVVCLALTAQLAEGFTNPGKVPQSSLRSFTSERRTLVRVLNRMV